MTAQSVSAPITVIEAPDNLVATLVAWTPLANAYVSLTWRDNAISESGFLIERADNGGAFVQIGTAPAKNNTGGVTWSDTTIQPGNTYVYQVRAVAADGTLTAYSNTAAATVPPLPPALASVTAIAAPTKNGKNATVTLTWVDVAGETGYIIQQATDANFTLNLVTTSVGANNTTFTTGNLARGTDYYFRVLAFNDAGPSGWVDASPFPITTP